jgi:hypothetical protein
MTYTYPEHRSEKGRFESFLDGALVFVLVGGFVAIWVVAIVHWWHGSEREGIIAVGVAVGFVAAGIVSSVRPWCDEIQLSEDGHCELRTKRRVVRLHVQQIRWVKWRKPDADNVGEHYIIGFDGGKMRVNDWDDFDDFVARLKKLNPQVDLSNYYRSSSHRELAAIRAMLDRAKQRERLRGGGWG